MSRDRHEPKILHRTHYDMLKWAVEAAERERTDILTLAGVSEQNRRNLIDAHDERVFFAKQGLKIIRRDVLARGIR